MLGGWPGEKKNKNDSRCRCLVGPSEWGHKRPLATTSVVIAFSFSEREHSTLTLFVDSAHFNAHNVFAKCGWEISKRWQNFLLVCTQQEMRTKKKKCSQREERRSSRLQFFSLHNVVRLGNEIYIRRTLQVYRVLPEAPTERNCSSSRWVYYLPSWS